MILTHNQLALENSLRRILPADVVSLWIPDGYGRAKDIIRGNHGTCFGTHPNVPVISVPYTLNACDALTDWTAPTGGVLSIDTEDKKEGLGALRHDITPSAPGATSHVLYIPAGSWDFSKKKYALFWLKCNRANTAFTAVKFRIVDTLGKTRDWNLTFSAGEWTAFKIPLHSGWANQTTPPPNLTLINYVNTQFQAADTVPFHHKIDDLRIAYRPSLIDPSVGWRFYGDDYIVVPDDKSLDTTDEITVGMWINPDDIVSESEHFANHMIDRNTEAAFEFFSYGATLAIYLNNNALAGLSVPCLIAQEWQFIAFTYDKSLASNNVKLFRNAVLRDQETYSQSLLVSSANLKIGTDGVNYLDSYAVLPFIANKAWTQQQMENFYNATKGLFAPRG